MFDRTKHQHDADTHVVKGAGLARGPALILGTILAVAGLVLFLHAGGTPTGGFPDGDARGAKFLGFESNGWTAFFTTAAGVILLFAAAQHLLAKLLGLGVGLALAACVVLDLVDGPGVLGLASANWAVDLGWGIAAVLLLLNVFAPRITHEEPVAADHGRLRHDASATRTVGTATDEPRTADGHRASSGARADDDRTTDEGHRTGEVAAPTPVGGRIAEDGPARDGDGAPLHRDDADVAARSRTVGTDRAAGTDVPPPAGAGRIER